jgi:hypothetical protein
MGLSCKQVPGMCRSPHSEGSSAQTNVGTYPVVIVCVLSKCLDTRCPKGMRGRLTGTCIELRNQSVATSAVRSFHATHKIYIASKNLVSMLQRAP